MNSAHSPILLTFVLWLILISQDAVHTPLAPHSLGGVDLPLEQRQWLIGKREVQREDRRVDGGIVTQHVPVVIEEHGRLVVASVSGEFDVWKLKYRLIFSIIWNTNVPLLVCCMYEYL